MRHRKYHSPAVAISAGLWYNINEESAVWQTVSTFPMSQLQEMIARVEPGSHFFVIEDLVRYIERAKTYRCEQRKQS